MERGELEIERLEIAMCKSELFNNNILFRGNAKKYV